MMESNQMNQDQVKFLNYLTSLGYQAMIFLGEIPNPSTQKYTRNLNQAKLLIDTLIMLQEKTVGNLNESEENLLNSCIDELLEKYNHINGGDQSDD